MLPTTLKVSQAAAPDATLETALIVFVLAALIIVPSLCLLYALDWKGVVEVEEAVPPA